MDVSETCIYTHQIHWSLIVRAKYIILLDSKSGLAGLSATECSTDM